MIVKNVSNQQISYLLLFVGLLQLCQFGGSEFSSSEEVSNLYKNFPAQVIWAVPTKNVDLPCDITPPTPSDSVTMVLWFKGSTGIPLYSIDCRGGLIENGKHWATSDSLGVRSFFVTTTEPSKAHLHIRNVEPEDEGLFRCRVDFFSSPTRNFRVNVSLVIPPSMPRIFDGQGHEVVEVAGPFLEGYDLFLSCQVNGGKPHPTVMWYKDDVILDGVVDTSVDSYTTVNQLTIRKISRSLHNAKFLCKAQSSFDSPPVVQEVLISVYLRPDHVKLILPYSVLSVQKTHTLKCETSGSYPPAEITWLLDGEVLKNSTAVVKQVGNVTISTLHLTVIISDNNKEITCRSSNPHIREGYIEDHSTLHISYPPAVYIVAGPGIDSTSLHEGSEVNLTCEAHANPQPHKYNWFHNEQLLEYNEVIGIIPLNKTLTLRRLARHMSGEYRCDAVNTEGETRSVPFKIHVLYKPRCRDGFQSRELGALENNVLTANCEVDAAPATVKFYWTYNNSQGNFLPVQGSRIVSSGLVSQLYFKPTSQKSFGTLACWASNSVGNQETPCYYHIKPARAPNPPQDCQIRYVEEVSVEVTCTPGEDGGVSQHFSLEVLENDIRLESTHDRAVNDQAINLVPQSPKLFHVLENIPVFYLPNLAPGHQYKLLIYALNSKGKSEPPVVFDNVQIRSTKLEESDISEYKKPVTYDEDDEIPRPENKVPQMYLHIAIASGIVLVLLSTLISIIACVCRRKSKPDQKAMELAAIRRRREPSDDGGFGDSFRRHSEMFTRNASIEQNVPISRRISQHLVIDTKQISSHRHTSTPDVPGET